MRSCKPQTCKGLNIKPWTWTIDGTKLFLRRKPRAANHFIKQLANALIQIGDWCIFLDTSIEIFRFVSMKFKKEYINFYIYLENKLRKHTFLLDRDFLMGDPEGTPDPEGTL
jgi:hypothetical protein